MSAPDRTAALGMDDLGPSRFRATPEAGREPIGNDGLAFGPKNRGPVVLTSLSSGAAREGRNLPGHGAANLRERVYAAHPFGMPWRFARAWQNDRRNRVR